MYKFLLYAWIVTLIVFIIWVGVGSIEVKIALAIIGLTFIPKIRNKLYKAPLVIRKSKVAFYSSFLAIFMLLIIDLVTWGTEYTIDFADMVFMIFIFLSFLLGSVIYGIPVSLLSDFLTADVKKLRFLLAFIIHIGFGIISFLFLGGYMIFAAFLALLFFLIDEFLRKRECTYQEI